MPLDPKQVRIQSAALDREITAMVGDFERELARVYVQLRERIVFLTNELIAKGGRVASVAVNLGIARAAARELEAVLVEAGYGDLVAGALDVMGDLAKYQGLGQTMVARVERAAAWSGETLDAFRQLKLNELLEVTAGTMRRVEQTLLRGIVGAQDRGELLNELVADLEVSLPNARTIYDTALSEFSRIAVTSTATGAADEAFMYSGPIDGLTRPFCLERVGRVFVREAIDAMDNLQLDNTLITGGGYNCRHTWLPIPAEDDLAQLAGTDAYVDAEAEREVGEAGAARERLKVARRQTRGN